MKAWGKTAFWPFISTCRSKGEARLQEPRCFASGDKGVGARITGDVSRAPVCVACNHVALLLSSLFYHLLVPNVASFSLCIYFPAFPVRAPLRKRDRASCASRLSPSTFRPEHVERLCLYVRRRCRHKGVISGVLQRRNGRRKEEGTDRHFHRLRQPPTKTMSGHYPTGTS